jgi:DNA helicase-2/ATP-dependent DNA helicase PcrA
MAVNRTRRFELPGIQDLNKDQDAALALPFEGQHLIIGGPGTGKSVMTLLRARRLLAEKGEKRYRFLAFNRLLDQSSRHLFGNEEPLLSRTLLSWFQEVWTAAFRGRVPTKEPNPGSTYREIDWESVGLAVDSASERGDWVPLNKRYHAPLPFLVIDEGQDMPPAFYHALVGFGFENFYVVADQNQQICDHCSSRQDIENHLAVEPRDTLELRDNYRNTRPIALLSHHFYPGDPASPKPRLPASKPSAITPELWQYGPKGTLSFEEVVNRILQISDRDPRKLIGVIAPNNTVRQKFLSGFYAANPTLDNGRPPIQTYDSGQQDNLNFGHGGIMVINAQACKGLEFEIAILADIDAHQPQNNTDLLMKRFYVMVTRARDQVILLRCGQPRAAIDALLPDDRNLLALRDDDESELEDDIPF